MQFMSMYLGLTSHSPVLAQYSQSLILSVHGGGMGGGGAFGGEGGEDGGDGGEDGGGGSGGGSGGEGGGHSGIWLQYCQRTEGSVV
eukprot:scaffold54742_cov57-Phaeocystis_antarctica.AAC.2